MVPSWCKVPWQLWARSWCADKACTSNLAAASEGLRQYWTRCASQLPWPSRRSGALRAGARRFLWPARRNRRCCLAVARRGALHHLPSAQRGGPQAWTHVHRVQARCRWRARASGCRTSSDVWLCTVHSYPGLQSRVGCACTRCAAYSGWSRGSARQPPHLKITRAYIWRLILNDI